MHLRIPSEALVLVVGGPRDPIAETAAVFEGFVPAPWNVSHPETSALGIHEAFAGSDLVRTVIKRSHARARTDAAAIAHKRGASVVCLRLPGSEPVDAARERLDQLHDVPGPQGLTFEIVPMPSQRQDQTGPFDIIGDVHGCAEELLDLLTLLGHVEMGAVVAHPEGRVPVLVGDLTDRGPENLRTLRIAMALTAVGGLAVRGNHDEKIRKWLHGRKVKIGRAASMTTAELEATTQEERHDIAEWLDAMQTHLVLDGGDLVVAHAGIDEEHQGRHTSGAEHFAMYGKPMTVLDGKGRPEAVLDADGFPMGVDWAQDYAGRATVVHGHVVYPEPRVVNNVVAIDTGCVFGGALTAYRWPERDFVQVPARKRHWD